MPTFRVGSGDRGPNGPLASAWQNLSFLFGITGVVLLIACVNIAALLLVRTTSRSPEIAMRRALGATRGRLVRQLLLESLLLAIGGAIVGLVVAVWAKDLIPRMMEDDVVLDTFVDLRALAFAAGLTTATALIFGTGHAVRASRTDALAWVKGAAVNNLDRRTLAVRTMMAVQVAASVMLLVMAGLFIRTIHNLSRVDVGFEPRNLLVFRIDPGPMGGEDAKVFALYERLVAAIEAVPGVHSATLSVMPVVAHSEWTEPVRPDDRNEAREVFIQSVRWNFFDTMRIPILAGRSLLPSDAAERPRVAVINEAMAQQLFGLALPLGRHFQFVNGNDRDVPIEVVGVVGNSRYARLEEAAPPPTFFMPYRQRPPQSMIVEVRTRANPMAFAPAIREAIRREDPQLPLIAMRTQEQQIGGTIRSQRMFATISVVSGLIALLLACVGLYGIVSYDAKRRTGEIGLRMALGARPRDVIGLVSARTLRVVSLGGVLGLLLAFGIARLIANQLFGVTPLDLPAMLGATVLMATVASVAAYIPARRASRIDPMVALRCE
jgi:predicted permease